MLSGVVPHYRQCLLVWCLTISHACWCGASLYVMPPGVVPYYHPYLLGMLHHYGSCLLVWCLITNHSCWCGSSLKTMPLGVVLHYRPCLMVNCHCNQYFTSRVQMEEGWFKSGATCTEMQLYQTCLKIQCCTQICLLVQCNYISHACWVHKFIYACL